MADRGEVFVLDMGEPVRIVDLGGTFAAAGPPRTSTSGSPGLLDRARSSTRPCSVRTRNRTLTERRADLGRRMRGR